MLCLILLFICIVSWVHADTLEAACLFEVLWELLEISICCIKYIYHANFTTE